MSEPGSGRRRRDGGSHQAWMDENVEKQNDHHEDDAGKRMKSGSPRSNEDLDDIVVVGGDAAEHDMPPIDFVAGIANVNTNDENRDPNQTDNVINIHDQQEKEPAIKKKRQLFPLFEYAAIPQGGPAKLASVTQTSTTAKSSKRNKRAPAGANQSSVLEFFSRPGAGTRMAEVHDAGGVARAASSKTILLSAAQLLVTFIFLTKNRQPS